MPYQVKFFGWKESTIGFVKLCIICLMRFQVHSFFWSLIRLACEMEGSGLLQNLQLYRFFFFFFTIANRPKLKKGASPYRSIFFFTFLDMYTVIPTKRVELRWALSSFKLPCELTGALRSCRAWKSSQIRMERYIARVSSLSFTLYKFHLSRNSVLVSQFDENNVVFSFLFFRNNFQGGWLEYWSQGCMSKFYQTWG